jgi:hypothetical protein
MQGPYLELPEHAPRAAFRDSVRHRGERGEGGGGFVRGEFRARDL